MVGRLGGPNDEMHHDDWLISEWSDDITFWLENESVNIHRYLPTHRIFH